MVNFSSMQISEFLKQQGVPENLVSSDSVNLYKLLGIEPRLKADGSRELTPYEILRVPPIFVNGKERPIVFSIKNKAKKLGKYEGTETIFFYKSKKVTKEKDLLETLKSNYRRAVFLGDAEQAESFITMIAEISEKDARELLSLFYDYNKFYRTMKKQLIIDLFAHFFLIYMKSAMRSVKKGLVRANKLYKPYREEFEGSYEQSEEIAPEIPDIALNPLAFGINNIEKVTINGGEGEQPISFDFKNKQKSDNFVKIQRVEEVPKEEIPVQKPVKEKQEKVEKPTQDKRQAEIPDLFMGKGKSILKKRKSIFAKHFMFNGDESIEKSSGDKSQSKAKSQTNEFDKKYEL